MVLFGNCGKYHFRIRKSSTKFHFKVRKPHFKLRKALFKRGLERNGKNKNVLEFDVEKDPFKYKIKDAKQLALKVTANSLYGQLGAPTSPIYLKAIAACFTGHV